MGNENGVLSLINTGLCQSGFRLDGEGKAPDRLLFCHQVVSIVVIVYPGEHRLALIV